jgi:hypothetical protein
MQSSGPATKTRPKKFHRQRKLVDRKLQLSVVVQLGLAATFGVLLQFGLFAYAVSKLEALSPEHGSGLVDEAYPELAKGLGFSLLVLVPLMTLLGIRVTSRIAGPIHRFKRFLEAVEAGEQVEECSIRKGDKLQDLCDLINRATVHERLEAGRRGQIEATRRAATKDAAA